MVLSRINAMCIARLKRPLLINMTVTVWHVLHPDPEALHLFSTAEGFSRPHTSSEWGVVSVCAALIERLSLEILHETQSSWSLRTLMGALMLHIHIYEQRPRLGGNFRLVWRVYIWPPNNIDGFWWKSSLESDLRLRHRPLSNRWCIFQLFSCWGKSVLMCSWRSWPMSLPSY